MISEVLKIVGKNFVKSFSLLGKQFFLTIRKIMAQEERFSQLSV